MDLKEDICHIFLHTENVWQKFANKTIFISGGTGFFGKWILHCFIHANDVLKLNIKVIVLSRNFELFIQKNPVFKHTSINYIENDVRDFVFPKEAIDFIIHAATNAGIAFNVEHPLPMFDTIVEGTRRILELAKAKKVASLLYVSSGAVYGKQPSEVKKLNEDYIGSPDISGAGSAYAEGKRVAEMMCHMYFREHQVHSKIVRCFAFVGPYLPLHADFAIGNFISDIVAGNTINIKGDGTSIRSYLYASDLMVWLFNAFIFGKTCRPYNVGSDQDLSIKELAQLIASCSEKSNIEIKVAKQDGTIIPSRYVPCIDRARDELGLKVNIGLKDAIYKTIIQNKYHANTQL